MEKTQSTETPILLVENIEGIVEPEYYLKTMDLRYRKKEIWSVEGNLTRPEMRLQQRLQGNRGTDKWEWIED